jgi:hypothetical protein
MPETKIPLFEMADAIGEFAHSCRGHVERWVRDHPNEPLPLGDRWVLDARRLETAHLTLGLMALDEEASRKFVSSIIAAKPTEAGLLMAMIRPPLPATSTAAEAT